MFDSSEGINVNDQLDAAARAVLESRWTDAADALHAMEPSVSNSDERGRWTALQIRVLDAKQRGDEASRTLDRSIGNDVDDPAFLFALAAQLAELGADAQAERTLKRLCDLDPRDPFAHANYAVFLGRQGRFQEAVDAYGAALERDPQFAPAYLQRAYCLHTLGRLDESAGDYRAYLECEPGDAAAWDALGAVEAERDRGNAALEAHRQAIALNPEQPLWLVNAATTARRLGRMEMLAEFADELERLAPGEWHTSLVRAYRQHENGDYGAAWSSYLEAFHRAEPGGDLEGLAVTGHAVLWYALTSKHSDVFDTYMKRVLARGIFSEGVLAAIRAWHGGESSAARNHEVVIEAAMPNDRAKPMHPEGEAVVENGAPAGTTVRVAGSPTGNSSRYRRSYEVVAENQDEAAALAMAFEGWCGGDEVKFISARAISEPGEGLRGVYAASMPRGL